MEEQTIKLGDYHISYQDGTLKIMNINHKHSIAVLPCAGNCIVVKPVPAGENQFKP